MQTKTIFLLGCLLLLVGVHAGQAQERYGYDGAGRLTSIHYEDGSMLGYTYDRNGNITAFNALRSGVEDEATAAAATLDVVGILEGEVHVILRLSGRALTTVDLIDLVGEVRATLVEGSFEAGAHRLSLVPHGLPSGVYFLRLRTGDDVAVTRVAIVQ